MAVQFASGAYMTFDLSNKLFVGGDDSWFDISIFVRYTLQANWSSGEPGPFSFASATGNEYVGITINAADGLSDLWNRGLGHTATAANTGNIQNDGVWHSWLWSYRERVGLDTFLYINAYHDGETDVDETNSASTVAVLDNYFRMAVGLSDYGGSLAGQFDCAVDEVAVWGILLDGACSTAMYKHRISPLAMAPHALLHYTKFHGEHSKDMITGRPWVTGSGTPTSYAGVSVAQPDRFSPSYGTINPYAMANSKYSYLRRMGKSVAAPAGGRIMSRLAGVGGGLVGHGGIAGPHGGLAG